LESRHGLQWLARRWIGLLTLVIGFRNAGVLFDFSLQMVFPDFHVGVYRMGADFGGRAIVRVAISDASVPIKPIRASANTS
jgi:hypothetical protein